MGRSIVCTLVVAALTACVDTTPDHTLVHDDAVYSRGPNHFVWCGFGIDTKPKHHIEIDEITRAMQRAKLEGTTLHLYAHAPGDTIAMATLERVFAAAAEIGVQMTTYDELSAGQVGGGVALSFDDSYLTSWTAIRPMLAKYHVHVTFFVTFFLGLTDVQRAQLRQLADDGNDIEYHSTGHLDAAKFSIEHDIATYLATDIVPALDAMRAEGYATRTFAYPYGSRTLATDEALRPYFDHLRAVDFTCPY
ncbi:MAG TPA: polysaccharide deacetylase family protein [Kofleriaceae bacterium]